MFDTSFVSFAFNHPSVQRDMLNSFDSMEDFEDLLDNAYLQDCDPEQLTITLTRTGKVPSLEKAEKEAYEAAKWVIDNMLCRKAWKHKLLPIAKDWAAKLAPTIVEQAPNYID